MVIQTQKFHPLFVVFAPLVFLGVHDSTAEAKTLLLMLPLLTYDEAFFCILVARLRTRFEARKFLNVRVKTHATVEMHQPLFFF